MTVCRHCATDKAQEEFYAYSGRTCKTCVGKNTRRVSLANAERKRKYNRQYHMRRRYGMDQAAYDSMLARQGGGCAICGGTCAVFSRLCVDHCHATGEVRGLLCNPCNTGLGKFKDSSGLLVAAARYLNKAVA